MSAAEDSEEKDDAEYISALGLCCSERMDKTSYEELQDS
jgi:hypothetical protein